MSLPWILILVVWLAAPTVFWAVTYRRVRHAEDHRGCRCALAKDWRQPGRGDVHILRPSR